MTGRTREASAHVVICWTRDGGLTGQGARSGGTGEALRIGRASGVGVINLARPAHRAFAQTRLRPRASPAHDGRRAAG
jgi:hypothetical protein